MLGAFLAKEENSGKQNAPVAAIFCSFVEHGRLYCETISLMRI